MREVSVLAVLLESIADVMENPGELSLLLVDLSITGKQAQGHAFRCRELCQNGIAPEDIKTRYWF